MTRTLWQTIYQGHKQIVRAEIIAIFAFLIVTLSLSAQVQAGFIVGADTGNDNEATVVGIINDYNTNNNPDLPTDIDLFKKTDDDAAFVFNMANGFKFYSDAGGTMPVTSEAQLTTLSTAYFEFTGPDPLYYYSTKAGNNINVYTFMSGLNLINVSEQDISHVSFWHVPEPSSCMLALLGVAVVVGKRLRRSNAMNLNEVVSRRS